MNKQESINQILKDAEKAISDAGKSYSGFAKVAIQASIAAKSIAQVNSVRASSDQGVAK